MPPGRRAIAGLLLAILVAGAALVAFLGQDEGSRAATPAGETWRTDPAQPPAPEAAAPRSRNPEEGTAERRPADPEGLVFVRGQVVFRGTAEPVPGAKVTILTGVEAIDFPETTERLGGSGVAANLLARWVHQERLEEIGGWKPAHSGATTAEGSFAIGVPLDLPSFRFEVDAERAVHDDDDRRFSLDDREVRAGLLLEVERAGSIDGTLRGPGGAPAPSGRADLPRSCFHPAQWAAVPGGLFFLAGRRCSRGARASAGVR